MPKNKKINITQKKKWIGMFIIGLALSATPLTNIFHEFCHYYRATIEGHKAEIISWSSTRVENPTDRIYVAGYFGECVLFLTLTVIFIHKSFSGLPFGMLHVTVVRAVFSSDFQKMECPIEERWLILWGILIILLWGIFEYRFKKVNGSY